MGSVALEEYELMKDSKYRVYVSAVDKALKNFEYTSEWADLISALGKLNKVLLSHMKFPVIPRRIKISKRLAQCMHPALPSGVHLKALETYDIIFKCMGTNRLSNELFIYSAGLFPLLGHAAMNVRPSLLTVYETHFVPLGERLRPGLSGFLSGVLPGLEEGSDHFDRTNSLLEKVCNEVGRSHFYGCLWECLASNSGIRLPAISFVLSHFNKKHTMEDQLYIMGTNIDVMVNALCAGVQDSSVLVQRSALDLLLVGFPMHNSQLVRADMVCLVTAALVTILRRDMSLNRRLFAWLLGSEVNISLLSSEHPLVKKSKSSEGSSSNLYFDMYSREMLIQAIKITLSQGEGESPHDLRPYRLLVSLLDKPDIGPVILDDILYEVFRALYLACESNDDSFGKGGGTMHKGSQELLKSANLFFSTLEPCYIWIYAGTLFDEACEQQTTNDETASPENGSTPKEEVKPVGSGPPNLLEVCTLTEFLLDAVSLETYMDTPSEHLPGLFLHVVTQLTLYCDALLPQEVARSLQLCAKVLSRVQPSALVNQQDSAKISALDHSEEKIKCNIQSDIAKSCSDVSSGQLNCSRANSDFSESSKTDKGKTETKKSSSKMKKSHSAKFRTKHSKTSLSNYSVSSPVLLSVVRNDGMERNLTEDLHAEVITKSAEAISSEFMSHMGRESPDIGSRSAGPSIECGLNQMDSSLSGRGSSSNKPLVVPEFQVPSKQQSMLEQSLRQYEKFYVKFVGGRHVISGRKICELFQELLVILPCETTEIRAAKLENLLYRCLNPGKEDISYLHDSLHSSSRCTSLKTNSYEMWVNLNSVTVCQSEQWEEPVKVASSLLVELSTFPTYCLPGGSSLVADEPMELTSFPEWLQVLVVCACWLSSAPALQLVAISTLLDLISLLRSQCESAGVSESEHQGVVAVVMVPLLKPWHVQYLEHHTNVVPVLVHSLWHHLGQLSSEHKVSCVELLHQLHNVLPSNDAVENIIGQSLTDENIERRVDAFQRFTLLWHIGREVETKAGINRNLRTFDKSLLKMLDNLQLAESCPLKLQAQSWLLHSLLRGDISRLVDPLLLMLLDPVTARMSVLHVNIEHSNTVLTCAVKDAESGDNPDEISATAKIYAISSVDGNVIYHVSDSTDQRKMKDRKEERRKVTSNPVRAKRIFAVTTLVGGGKRENHYITEKNSYVKEHENALSLTKPQVQNISVFVNPFSSNTTNSNTSNDSATEDDSMHFSNGEVVTAHKYIRNATRFHQSEIGREEKPADILDSSSRKGSNPEFVECVSKLETVDQRLATGYEESVSGGNLSSNSNMNDGLEVVRGDLRRWSVGDEEMLGDLEESTTAEEFFGNGSPCSGDSSSVNVVEEILHDVLHMVVSQSAEGSQVKSENKQRFDMKSPGKQPMGVGVHQLHSHMLLYCGVYDSNRTLYALSSLRSILLTNARIFLCAAAATGLANVARSSDLLVLLARHRKSVFGRSFHGDIAASSGEFGATYRSSMYLEVLISVCLYFARSYYPNLGQMRLTQEEIAGNRQVQLASAEILMLICSELIYIVRDSGKGFACYIADLLSRCKVQKVVLHCVLSSVYNMKSIANSQEVQSLKSFSAEDLPQQRTFTEEIVYFNDPVVEGNENAGRCKYRGSDHSEGFQIQLLRLLLALIMLEHQVNSQKGDGETPTASKEVDLTSLSKFPANQFKYIAGHVIPQQPMFLAAILSALQQDHTRHLHQHWTTLVTSALPFMAQSLTHVVMSVVNQLCCNVEKMSAVYRTSSSSCTPVALCCLPADYMVTQLEALTVLCHYCLLDSTQQLSHAFSQQMLVGSGTMYMGIPGANPGQIFNNLIHVFMPTPLQQDPVPKEKLGQFDPHVTARRTVLSNMPRIIASVSVLWQAVIAGNEWEHQRCALGSPRVVKHHLLEFFSPISLHHGINFLAAIAVAWQERKGQLSLVARKVVPTASPDQQVLVYLVAAIRVMPIDTLVQTVHQVVKQPPPIQGAKKDLTLEVSILELFYCYMQTCSGPQLAESWGSLIGLLRDGLTLTPPAQFLSLAILNEFVQKCCPLAEKKDMRDLQDITAKLVESCSQIAGACLEQTTWLRRNLAVREEEPAITSGTKDKEGSGVSCLSTAQYSVQAQAVLAELLAPLLDVSYGSQEKERVVALLTALMYNITPYLKNHTRRNIPSFHACSQLLASLSSYQYTRKAWRRDVFDLLLDPALFQMEANCLPYWKTIVDNLMTHDNTTFRDLMSRVSVAQSGSLSIFSSREQEYEQRAQLLKRLAFVILCSETDQYHKYMPEIQERLSDSLRLPQVVPSIQAQVFLCFRVLLSRMSPQHVTSLWPNIISEMVQVFLHIEQELSTDTEEFSSHIRLLSALDSSWVVNSNNGLHAHGHPHWLQLQLAAAKLLDMAVLLPAHRLPQFQMYRWAFVGAAQPTSLNNNHSEDEIPHSPDFVPHVMRIARLMDQKFQRSVPASPRSPGKLLLVTPSIKTLQELHLFFTALSVYSPSVTIADCGQGKSVSLSELEAVIERDFLEKLPTR
ncbi:protein dopey-1 homolog isoform X2 [Zootermopsis nevadensis]|uniref:Dopey-1-like protein n=1 Tax=Zootermopsis nevadensis TaxID=136037 RepID=A0A067R0E9_ZOONE|nr:protein dopey-1 homolog isoform X2 [Zootermopsis nevadensis]KDR16353.1 Dopey-1-like protein [Zootermopsis nevadensis]